MEEVRQVGGVPAGTIRDVNQWLIGWLCPTGEGKVAFVGSRSTRKEDRDPETGEYSTRERWVFVPRKCLVQELFICRLSTKIFALKWVLRFPPQSSILLLPQPSNPPIFCPRLKVALQRRPVPWPRMYGKFACWLNSMKLLRKKKKKKNKKSVNPCSRRKSGFYRVRKFDTQLFLFSSTRFAANRKRKILVLGDCGLYLDWKRFAHGR